MIILTVSKFFSSKFSSIISSGYFCTCFCTPRDRLHKIISTGKILFLVNNRIIYGICVPVCIDCKILFQRSNAVWCFFCIGRFSHIPACKCITGFGRVLTICNGDLTFVQSFFCRFIRATVRIIFNRIRVSDIFHDDLCASVCCDFLLFYWFCGKSVLFCRIYCCGIAYFSGKGSGQRCIGIGFRFGQICFFVSFIRNTLYHLISNGICLEGDRNRIFFRVFSISSTKYISVYGKSLIVNLKSIACRDVFYGIAYFIIAAILLSKHTSLGMSGNGSVFIQELEGDWKLASRYDGNIVKRTNVNTSEAAFLRSFVIRDNDPAICYLIFNGCSNCFSAKLFQCCFGKVVCL